MAKPVKKKVYFTSLDIVIYAVCIFALGIGVGLGFGRYKNSRYYFYEEKLRTIEKTNDDFKDNNAKIEKAIKEKIEPLIATIKDRLLESGMASEVPKDFNFTRTFTNVPDFIIGMTAIKLNLADGANTLWAENVVSTVNKTGVHIESLYPEMDVGTYWIAVPDLTSK